MSEQHKPKFIGSVYENGAINLPKGVRDLFQIGPESKFREFDATIDFNGDGIPVIEMVFRPATPDERC